MNLVAPSYENTTIGTLAHFGVGFAALELAWALRDFLI